LPVQSDQDSSEESKELNNSKSDSGESTALEQERKAINNAIGGKNKIY
jgi:hypothetical protein